MAGGWFRCEHELSGSLGVQRVFRRRLPCCRQVEGGRSTPCSLFMWHWFLLPTLELACINMAAQRCIVRQHRDYQEAANSKKNSSD